MGSKVELESPRRFVLPCEEMRGLNDVVRVGSFNLFACWRCDPTVDDHERDMDALRAEMPSHRLSEASLSGLGGREPSRAWLTSQISSPKLTFLLATVHAALPCFSETLTSVLIADLEM